MPSNKYKVIALGNPLGIGVTGARHLVTQAVGKAASTNEPFIVANELIANGIARILLLPCPPGALMDAGGQTYYVSLDFNLSGLSLPPAPVGTIVSSNPTLAWGIILFDVLIMNGDRHGQNISYDTSTGVTQIFDHSHALLGTRGDVGMRMATCENNLAIGGHCLAQLIHTRTGLSEWLEKISKIPDYFIDELVGHAVSCGFPAASACNFSDFLLRRRDKIPDLVQKNPSSFPKLPPPAPSPPPAMPANVNPPAASNAP